MNHADKMLYHQIHPAKLLTDVGTSLASTWLLWQARWFEALSVGFLPSIVVTLLLVQLVDLERWRLTRLGVYVTEHMTSRVVGVRVLGQLVVWIGAWQHAGWLVPFGYFIVVLGWINGLWDPATDGQRAPADVRASGP